MTIPTRAEQKVATRQAIVVAAAQCLTTDGYGSVRTRAVAQLAGVAQGTVTYHFPNRQGLLAAAVGHVFDVQVTASESLVVDRDPASVSLEDALDQLWQNFLTPPALAVAHLFAATWTEPELVATVRELEDTVFTGVVRAFCRNRNLPEPDLAVLTYFDLVLSFIRGLVESIPTRGVATVETRWNRAKTHLIAAAPLGIRNPVR